MKTDANICRVRYCKNETCDPALLMCFDHVGKDALLLLVHQLREEAPKPTLSLSEYVAQARKRSPKNWFKWIEENLPLENSIDVTNLSWIGDSQGGLRWKIHADGEIELNLQPGEMEPQIYIRE